MIKQLLTACLLILFFSGLKAQPYGNEWINYSQKYYKIKIAKNGIYRIDSTSLAASGLPLNSIDPRNFQIFNKGIQQYIFVQGASDGVFNSADFIEFYAEGNDGKSDSLLYTNSSFVPNPYYSLVNDTAVYFLTWNSSITNNRILPVNTDTTLIGSLAPDNYFFKEEIQSYHSGYFSGETDVVGGTDARYTKSEGWFDGTVLGLGASLTYTVNTLNKYATGPNTKIKIVAIGASKDVSFPAGVPDHNLKIEYNAVPLVDTFFKGYASNRFIYDVPTTSLGSATSTSTVFQFTSINSGYTSNRTTVSYITVKYPHTFDLEGASNFLMYLPDNGLPKSYLNISNFTASGTLYIYDLSNHKRIATVQSGSNYKALVPNPTNGTERKCFISSAGNITHITSVQPVTSFAKFTDYSLLAADSAFLIISHKSLMLQASEYKTYRSSIAGGSHHVILADIDELYDQFAYGIIKSPFAIRGFADYLLDTYPNAPQNLFLLGKSLHLKDGRQNNASYANNLVPSFGNPSSDNLFTSELYATLIEPAIPTGRLAARNNNDIFVYLQKVKDYENVVLNPPAEWKKRVLHFGGGSSAGEQNTLRTYLNNYKAAIEDTYYGGNVISFFKTSSAPMQLNSSTYLDSLINNGVSLMTFFGHSSSSIGFDQGIDAIGNYNLAPHFPFVLANGCYAGDLHGNGMSTSEEFTLIANKGVIGYLGSVGLGVPYALDFFSSGFYNQVSRLGYGKGVGYNIKRAIHNIPASSLTDELVINTCYEMTLHGDPAIILNAQRLPDYKITNTDVYFDVISDPSNIIVNVVRTNLGKATHDTIVTEIQRIFPNGDTVYYLQRSAAPLFKDTISFPPIPIEETRGIGLNKIKVSLDARLNVNELNEDNNTTNPYVNLLIYGGDIVPVYPHEFAIIPTDTITLKASTSNPFAAAKNYKFQIDTTDTFNSPFLKSTIINAPGGVVQWKLNTLPYPAITFTDSTVYYWRVSPDSTSPASGYSWRESSFQYITGKHGWEQAHFFQFKNDGYQYVKFNRPQRKFDFANDIKNISCTTGIYPYIPWGDVKYSINGSLKSTWTCLYPRSGFTFAIFDPITGESQISYLVGNGLGQYGDYHCVPNPYKAFEFFDDTKPFRDTMASFLNGWPDGTFVLGYSETYMKFNQYETKINNAFKGIGANDMTFLPDSVPYIIWGVKGAAQGTATEIIGSSKSDILTLNASFSSNWNEGVITSPVIGPALSWGSLHWRQKTLDGINTQDSIEIKLIGIRANGTDTILYSFPKDSIDVLNLSNYVNAQQYPNIRLVAYMKDNTLHTPPQMKRWQVIYQPVPEAAINPSIGYTMSNNDVQQGDNIVFHLPIQNIGDVPFTDSLLVTYWIEDVNSTTHSLPFKLKKKPFIPGEVIFDTINLNTSNYKGANALWVEVNPLNQTKSQLEQYHFNNIARIPFNVAADRVNPLLDVTFDGAHILNNDIVSAKPNILIQLKDENKFLALNDTSDFKIFMVTPSSNVAQQIYFGNFMSFIPAVLPNNSCKINYTPVLLQDGTYQLLVQAKDKSGNQSGAFDYKINFEIINKASITEVMNYPNPFSTATHFVFTLTGSEVPSNFKIQIMTITGKVVREIFQDELGTIHVGRNITDYAWNGRDEFGDQLANGVYLYRVITKLNGADIEKRQSDADQYFKKGWGKMFLMR